MASSLDEDFGLSIAAPSIASPRTVLVRRPMRSAGAAQPSRRPGSLCWRGAPSGRDDHATDGRGGHAARPGGGHAPRPAAERDGHRARRTAGDAAATPHPWGARCRPRPRTTWRAWSTREQLRELEQLEAGESGRHSRREQFQIDLEEAMASHRRASPPDRRRLLDDLGTRRRERLRRAGRGGRRRSRALRGPAGAGRAALGSASR